MRWMVRFYLVRVTDRKGTLLMFALQSSGQQHPNHDQRKERFERLQMENAKHLYLPFLCLCCALWSVLVKLCHVCRRVS